MSATFWVYVFKEARREHVPISRLIVARDRGDALERAAAVVPPMAGAAVVRLEGSLPFRRVPKTFGTVPSDFDPEADALSAAAR